MNVWINVSLSQFRVLNEKYAREYECEKTRMIAFHYWFPFRISAEDYLTMGLRETII